MAPKTFDLGTDHNSTDAQLAGDWWKLWLQARRLHDETRLRALLDSICCDDVYADTVRATGIDPLGLS